MPGKLWHWLAFGAGAGILGLACWPGSATNPATLISRVDLVATLIMLAALPVVISRRFGGPGQSRLARLARIAGYLTVIAVVSVKAQVQRLEYAGHAGRPWLVGLWAGELAFLALLGGYLAGLLAVTARKPPVSRTSLAIGGGVGLLLGVLVYAVRPLDDHLRMANHWLAALYIGAKVVAVPLILGLAIAAGLAAARRTRRRNTQLPLEHARARQGVTAGLCAGVTAALVVCVLGMSTIALIPHAAGGLQWTLPHLRGQLGSIYRFELSASDAGAGYLLVLAFFPLLGAGLGAWGGLAAAGRHNPWPGGNGGGGPKRPEPPPPPPAGGRQLEGPATDLGARRLLDLPPWPVPDQPAGDRQLPPRRREPVSGLTLLHG